MTNTIAVIGSSRRAGNTGQLIDWVAGEIDCEVIDLGDQQISPYDYQHRNLHDDFIPLVDNLLKADNIVFASPVYWYAMSAQMKVFFDRLSDLLDVEDLKDRGRKLREKNGFVVATSISQLVAPAFKQSFIDTFGYLGMNFGGSLHANCADGFDGTAYKADVEAFVELIRNSGSRISTGGITR